MMKVIVTGCKGQVGSCLVELLSGKAEVLAVERQQVDIALKENVLNMVAEFNPDYIINAAAYTAVDRAEEEVYTAYATNADGAQYLAEASEMYGAVMLHISTDYVFDGKEVRPYCEEDVTGPQGIYGKSKLAGEQAVARASRKHLILRTAWVFGEQGHNFVKTMLWLAQNRDELSIVGDQFGGPTYAKDIALALIRMIETIEAGNVPKWGVYHFSGMPYVSWFEFAESIFSIAELKGVITKQPRLTTIATSLYPTKAKRPANSRMDCRKINQVFGIEPSDWKRALENIKAYK